MEQKFSGLTEAEAVHLKLMHTIAQGFYDTPMVLKGGTALLIGYGLDRFSEDLDFNSPKKLNLESKIKSTKNFGTYLHNIRLVKDTPTTTRYKMDYEINGFSRALKIEISHRDGIAPAEVAEVRGVKIYKLTSLIDQKIYAAEDRNAIRDIFDLNFLIKNYPDKFTSNNLNRLYEKVKDVNKLASEYQADYDRDLLIQQRVDFEALVLEINERASQKVLTLKNKRDMGNDFKP